MEELDSWTAMFFSGSRPNIPKTNELDRNDFRSFCIEDDWKLGSQVDSRGPHANTIQVFWLWIEEHRHPKYVGKVFPPYSKQEAEIQLGRIRVSSTPERIDDAVYEFDRFYREARAYSHIDMCCSARERIYFPQFHGVITNIPKSRFSSGYWHERGVVLEAIRPKLCSRRVLSEDVNHLSESFSETLKTLSGELLSTPAMMSLSSFEQEWYHSLLKDRLRRLHALHQIGITHGDIHDYHFRLPNDIYDTVLYDFSESYTFSEKQPFRVNSGKPRPLWRISAGECERVLLDIQNRVSTRDLRSYLSDLSSEASVDNALWQSLDKEEELLELIMLKVSFRPDGFSMPTLNSIFPFLEAVCPNFDLCWHIRRGRLLRHYGSVWAVFRDDETWPQKITFSCEPQFGTMETKDNSRFMICLVPNSWNLSLKTNPDFARLCTLRKFCSRLVSAKIPGAILKRDEFLKAESGEVDKESCIM